MQFIWIIFVAKSTILNSIFFLTKFFFLLIYFFSFSQCWCCCLLSGVKCNRFNVNLQDCYKCCLWCLTNFGYFIAEPMWKMHITLPDCWPKLHCETQWVPDIYMKFWVREWPYLAQCRWELYKFSWLSFFAL